MRSSATSSAFAGRRPWTFWNALETSWLGGNQATPMVGAACWMKSFWFFSKTSAVPWMTPCARSTPFTWSIWLTRLSGTGGRFCWLLLPGPVSALNGSRARTTASTPWLAFANSESKTLPSVSVSTNVPAMNATPSTTASDVSASRNFLARRPLIVTRNTDQPPSCFILSRTASAEGEWSSSTILPSARNTTRFA